MVDDEGFSSQLRGAIHSGKFQQGHQQRQILPLEPSGAQYISSGELDTLLLASAASLRAGSVVSRLPAPPGVAWQPTPALPSAPLGSARWKRPAPPAGVVPMVRSGQPSRGPSARRVGSARQARGRAHLPGCGAAHSASHAHSFARSQRAECGAALRLSWRSRVRRPGEPPEQVRVAPSFARGSEPHLYLSMSPPL